jgi:hypothetical protein
MNQVASISFWLAIVGAPIGVRTIGNVGSIMRIWLEYDPVALAVLVFGIAAVELLALSI